MMKFSFLLLGAAGVATAAPVFVVKLPRSHGKPVLGRVRVYLSSACGRGDRPPRAQCSDDQDTAQVFGVDTPATGLLPGDTVLIDETTLGYPRHTVKDLPSGGFCVQAELFPYKKYVRGDGFNLTLPTSCVSDAGGDGAYGSPPGTLYSRVLEVVVEPGGIVGPLDLSLVHEVPQTASPGCSGRGSDTKWIKTVRTQSALLTKFWGEPITLEACVLLPWGFDDHPTAKYPLVIAHGHYSAVFTPGGRFDDTPPSGWKRNLTGYDLIDQKYAYWLYTNWTAPHGPFKNARALVMTLNHPVPFFDDSYAVDSVNVGPYGTAIMTELIPKVEAAYRGIGQGWARGVFGGSTGGWEAFATQVLFPDEFNYAVAACPDPIGFSSYTTIDLYTDQNAYFYDHTTFKRTPRPGYRDHYSGTAVLPGTSTAAYGRPYGHTTATIEEMNRREYVLGERSRSCGQWDIWEAVFGPQAADGYPARIWCKDPSKTSGCKYGQINQTVAAYWRDHFDMTQKVRTGWAHGLGKKLSGKLHVYVGGSDSFFLTNAVMDLQDWVQNQPNLDPPFGGEITIGAHDGRGYEHCFNGYLPDGNPAVRAMPVTL